MGITTKRFLSFMIVNILILSVKSCSKGLTQLRYPKTLELMYCIPNTPDQLDSCRLLTGGKEASCQQDFDDEYVCCGSVDLFIELLSNGDKKGIRPRPKAPPRFSILQKDDPRPDNLRMHDDHNLNSIHIDYEEDKYQNWALHLSPTSTTPTAILFPKKQVMEHVKHSTTKKPYSKRPITYRTFSLSPITKPHYTTTHAPIKESTKLIIENGPVITLITVGYFAPGNNSISWSGPSTVVLLQDGHCSVVINTGLPIQKNDIVASLSAKNLFRETFNFTVVTSSYPQFIGNLNLFESQELIVGLLGIQRSIITSNKLETNMDLCSHNTQVIHTPGPTPDSISVLAKNVPGMGTVAITGALFIQDDNLDRIDFPFVWNQDLLFESRKEIICMSDWIIPGHSVPIPISRQTKAKAGCSRT